jgi:hypothetical protein
MKKKLLNLKLNIFLFLFVNVFILSLFSSDNEEFYWYRYQKEFDELKSFLNEFYLEIKDEPYENKYFNNRQHYTKHFCSILKKMPFLTIYFNSTYNKGESPMLVSSDRSREYVNDLGPLCVTIEEGKRRLFKTVEKHSNNMEFSLDGWNLGVLEFCNLLGVVILDDNKKKDLFEAILASNGIKITDKNLKSLAQFFDRRDKYVKELIRFNFPAFKGFENQLNNNGIYDIIQSRYYYLNKYGKENFKYDVRSEDSNFFKEEILKDPKKGKNLIKEHAYYILQLNYFIKGMKQGKV